MDKAHVMVVIQPPVKEKQEQAGLHAPTAARGQLGAHAPSQVLGRQALALLQKIKHMDKIKNETAQHTRANDNTNKKWAQPA